MSNSSNHIPTLRIGSVIITPIFEIEAGEVIQDCVKNATPNAVTAIEWLKPNYADEHGKLKAQVQSFLIEAGGRKIVVDTGIGNGRDRPEFPLWANMQTDFMDRIRKLWSPSEVDLVVCTHMHFDHVGWNTTYSGGNWLPTFPNAQYLFCEHEFNYWKERPSNEVIDDHNGFKESVLPVYDAGLVQLVPDGYKVTDEISLVSTPGHTPGHVSVLIESNSMSALITGDALHHPCQIAHPEWKSFDTDSELANKTRRTLLERFADTNTLLIGSHFADPAVGKIKRFGNDYVFTEANL